MGSIGNKIGQAIQQNQQKSDAVHTQNEATRTNTEAAKNKEVGEAAQAAGSIFSSGEGSVSFNYGNVPGAIKEGAEALGAIGSDAISDVATALSDAGAELREGAENVIDTIGEGAKGAGAWLGALGDAVGDFFGGVNEDAAKRYEEGE